ncbi:MAG: hypothetical protein SO116_08360 [Treponema sp.]|nr:hypothetical protein [Treponema sp.]
MISRKDYISDSEWNKFLNFSKELETPNIVINLKKIKANFLELKNSFHVGSQQRDIGVILAGKCSLMCNALEEDAVCGQVRLGGGACSCQRVHTLSQVRS